MRVRITMPSKDGKRLKEQVLPLVAKVEDDEWGDEWELVRFHVRFPLKKHLLTPVHAAQVGLIDAGNFRVINTLLEELKGKGKIETISFSAVEGDERIE